MSDLIKHECGVAFIRLLKPLEYYHDKYGDILYGLKRMNILMEKQKNRGQDGAGVATIKLDVAPGKQYIDRRRTMNSDAITHIFNHIGEPFAKISKEEREKFSIPGYAKEKYRFLGELILGHLRYATHGDNEASNLHPRIRHNNWITRSLVVAGNFNLTNVNDLFQKLVDLGQIPREMSDTMTVLEKIGHFLDVENQRLFDSFKRKKFTRQEITPLIQTSLDYSKILKPSADQFDGGYLMAGMVGHGDAFFMRDPHGIRPAFYYKDDEVVVVASERPAIQTAFGVHFSKVNEIAPGHALIIKKDGSVGEIPLGKPMERKSCSFERIYFSRGNDKDIYKERKELGRRLAPIILEKLSKEKIEDVVFSYIPNTAEIAFLGLIEGIQETLMKKVDFKGENLENLEKLLKLRVEKIAIKDAKLRTFITEDNARNDMVSHVYDVTYGVVKSGVDTLVVLDDSIVRGTTLKESIISMLDRLQPKKIIVVSSAPQIKYPDCYGIDMSKIDNFVAFKAAISLWKDRKGEDFLLDLYRRCKEEVLKDLNDVQNLVKEVYQPFTDEEISKKISEIVRPNHIFSDVEVVFQRVEDLHVACPNNKGDWYFTGDFPTSGGNLVAVKSYINYYEGNNVRAY